MIYLPSYLTSLIQIRASRIVQMVTQDVLQQFGLRPTQWSILGLIYIYPPGVRASDIAKELGVEVPLVTMLTHDLIERGMVAKSLQSSDKRARILVLTASGRHTVKTIESLLQSDIDELLSGIEAQDLHAHHNVLQTIIANSGRVLPS